MSNNVTIPHGFSPRDYQKGLFNALANGKKRGVTVWHRRAGKDKTFLAMCAKEAIQRVGVYFYILPYYKQARKAIWDGIDKDGTPFLSVFHESIVKHRNNQEMVLTLKNGSICYFLGSDNVDALVGANPVGLFFSEYSLHKPHVWDLLRPILIENGGIAFFNGTPRGRNHLFTLFKAAQQNPDEWYSDILTVADTGIMTEEQVEKEIREGMARATANQEFYCNWDAALQGAYYEEALNTANAAGMHTAFPIDPYIPVDVAWDLGMSDSMVLLFVQQVAQERRIIDCVANTGKGFDYYVRELKNRKYIYNNHYLPHDVKVRELGNGKSRLQTLRDLGIQNITVCPKAAIEDGINATRRLLYSTYIHTGNCHELLEALRSYRADYDEVKRVYGKPIHDWSSNYADALRQYAIGNQTPVNMNDGLHPEIALGTGYDPVTDLNPTNNRPSVYDRVHQPLTQYPTWNPRDHQIADGFYGRY